MSSPDKPPRRFKPQLVEQTATSSKKPKRFAPEPISTTTRSRRNQEAEPSEVSSDTPAANNQEQADAVPRAEPVPDQDPPKDTPKPRRKFAVEPIETTTRNNRKHNDAPAQSGSTPTSSTEKAETEPEPEQKPPRRRFAPQLIETAKRSRKSGDTLPAVLPGDKTNVSPGDLVKKERPPVKPIPPSNTPATSMLEVPQVKPAPARQGSIRAHPNTRANSRYHSVRIPSLPDIESSESDESRPPSLSRSQGGEDSDTSDEGYKDATRRRESIDENFSGYLLALAARAAERQLREQEAAAFANTDIHEPVAHYMNRSDSEGEVGEPKLGRYGQVAQTRHDSGDERAMMQELRKHGEKVFEQQKRKQRTAGFDVEFDGEPSRQDLWSANNQGPFANPAKTPKNVIGGHQQCPELKQMRKAASPPMLGGEIYFPRCASPDHARFDVTQGADYLRKNICYLTEQSSHQQGLWGNDPAKEVNADENKQQDQGKGKGLWGGLCNPGDQKAVKTPGGLVTPMRTPLRTPVASPRNEKQDPMSHMLARAVASDPNSLPRSPVRAPPSPPAEDLSEKQRKPQLLQPSSFAVLEWKLEMEARLDEEFGDDFVTQVYNYLSFGYPALARKYDEELARVTKIQVEELREDDEQTQVHGYVRLEVDEGNGGDDGFDETSCKRWRALRRYIKEWGKQMMLRERENGNQAWSTGAFDPHGAWGLPARRGSWGL